MAETIFANGIMWKDVSDKAPAWIKGQICISPERLNTWLAENPDMLSPKGWLTLDVKQPKDENKSYYLSVNLFRPKVEQPMEELVKALNDQHSELPNPSDVPF